MRKYTPENITELEENEIFVFGSNLAGRHGAGAAKLALDKFGAIYGKGEGLQGQSYAFPTLDHRLKKFPKPKISLNLSIGALYVTCFKYPNLIFLLTKVGTELAGYSEEYMKKLFKEIGYPPDNLVFPEGW